MRRTISTSHRPATDSETTCQPGSTSSSLSRPTVRELLQIGYDPLALHGLSPARCTARRDQRLLRFFALRAVAALRGVLGPLPGVDLRECAGVSSRRVATDDAL